MAASAPPSSTCWSLILAARSPRDGTYEQAWTYLHTRYRPVVERYFARHAPTRDLADEWTAEFMSDWVSGKLDGANPTRGRFRHYIHGALRHFRNTRYRNRKRAQAREGRAAAEVRRHADADDEGPEAAFDRDFAGQVLSRALEQLEAYQRDRQASGSSNRAHDLVVAYHIDPESPAEQPSMAALSARFDLSRKACERQLDYARRKLRAWILAELTQLVEHPGDLCEEIDLLMRHASGAFEGV